MSQPADPHFETAIEFSNFKALGMFLFGAGEVNIDVPLHTLGWHSRTGDLF